jgi:hypothetical protein
MSRAPKLKEADTALGREEVEMDTEALLPNPRNARKHDDKQISRLAASLKQDGQTKPVLARRENRMLIAGHGVHQAAKMIGLAKLKVVLLDVDQAAADRIMLADNRFSDLSTTDNARVTTLLREIDAADWLSVGYDDDEVGRLFSKLDAADLVVHEIEASDRQDKFWISVYGPLREQARALQRLKDVYREMPHITVVLGTTPDLH